jgi:hypothetical protein
MVQGEDSIPSGNVEERKEAPDLTDTSGGRGIHDISEL